MLIGLVGKPNCGKSTFFKASTLAEVEIANRPFVTLKPNHGIGYVKIECVDKDFSVKCQPNHGFCVNSQRFIPVELMDVAGLVPGASEGKGLGNKFLDDLRQADAFIHIVDVSGTTDEEGKQAENYNPINDIIFLEEELDKWYYEIFMRVWKSFSRKAELEHADMENFYKEVAKQFSGLKIKEEHVKEALKKMNFSEKPSSWNDEQIKKFASILRHESKPMIIAANKIDIEKSKENYEKLREKFPNLHIVPCSADFELALREAAKLKLIEYIPGEKDFKILSNKINENQKQALEKIRKKVLNIFETGTGIQSVLNYVVFSLLDYIAVFPVENANKLTDSKGNILPDCFLMPEGSTALDLAYLVHSNLGENFIKAIDAKTKRVLGKEYKLKHRDVLEIVIK